MIRKNFHAKIKQILCGVLAAGMLFGQVSTTWVQAADTSTDSVTDTGTTTASAEVTPTPDPHTQY